MHARSHYLLAGAILPAALLLAAALPIAGCEKDPSRPRSQELNPQPPNANDRIVSEVQFGDAGKLSAIWNMEVGDGAAHWISGRYNGEWFAGRLDAAGNLLSHTTLSCEPRDLEVLSVASPVPSGAIVVGALDSDHDGSSETGNAMLLSPAGTVTSAVPFTSDSSDVFLYAAAPLSESLFVAVGGERLAGQRYPLVALLAVTASGALEKRQQVVLTSLAGAYGYDVETDPREAGSETRRAYMILDRPYAADVCAVTLSPSTLEPCTVAWTRALSGKGAAVNAYNIRLFGDALFVAGSAGDPGKTPAPEGGRNWECGMVVRLSLAGDIAWSQMLTASRWSDRWYVLEPAPDAITVAGEAASWYNTESGDAFGYGWIARVRPADGSVLSSGTFGSETYRSLFNWGRSVGAEFHAGGYTREETLGATYQAWWCVLDLIAATAGRAALAPSGAQEVRAAASLPPARPTEAR